MSKTVEIKVSDHRAVINNIFDHMEQDLKIPSFELEHDFYHDFFTGMEIYNPYVKPESGLGQLYDDWEFLQPLLKDKESSLPLMFIHVAPLLRYIAQSVRSYPLRTEVKK